jgi:uncharacterized protein (DUF427 family)
VSDYPAQPVAVNHVEPVPRRIRAVLAGQTVLDTTRAQYVWELPYFPQYYIPAADVRGDLLVPLGQTKQTRRGTEHLHDLRIGETRRVHAAWLLKDSPVAGLADTVRFAWEAMDAWFEEDERVFVHPRNPYVRVDALRSSRTVRVELGGPNSTSIVLAESSSPVMVFETGLPTRYYLNRTDVDFSHLVPSDTVSACPYKGTTSGYWSVQLDGTRHNDLAWTYDFPTRGLLPIASMIAFYNEKVDTFLDGQLLDRPVTHFS